MDAEIVVKLGVIEEVCRVILPLPSPQPKQIEFLKAKANVVGFGGARGRRQVMGNTVQSHRASLEVQRH